MRATHTIARFLVIACMSTLPARAEDWSDLWRNLNFLAPTSDVLVLQRDLAVEGAIFTYGPDGKPTWYALEQNRFDVATRVLTAKVLRTRALPSGLVVASERGTATIEFAPPELQAAGITVPAHFARLSYTIDGVSGTSLLARERSDNFGPQGRDYVDSWVDPADTSGLFKLDIVQHGGTVQASIRLYDDHGHPTFFSVPGFTIVSPGRWTGDIWATSRSRSQGLPAVRLAGEISVAFDLGSDEAPVSIAMDALIDGRRISRTLQPYSTPSLDPRRTLCVGTFTVRRLVSCPGAPGNAVFAEFEYSGTLRIEGGFHWAPGVDAGNVVGKPTSITGRVFVEPGIPSAYRYDGNGACTGISPATTGSVRPSQHVLPWGTITIGTYSAPVGFGSSNGRHWGIGSSAEGFDGQCDIQ